MNKKLLRLAEISSLLDKVQGNLILKWNTWQGSQQLKQIGLPTLYSCTALFFLISFAIEAFIQDQVWYASILLVFSGLTVCSYIYLRITGNKHITNSFLVFLLGVLCLFLVYTGGVGGTGPLWCYVFPIFALYVQRLWTGILSVIVLFVTAAYLLWHPVAGFDPEQYSQVFKERFLAVYIAVSVMSFFYAFIRASSEMELINLNLHLRDIADTDELTQLPNRRRMQDILYQEIGRFQRSGNTFCIIMSDIDHFKNINDTFGHDCGDAVLRAISVTINTILRTQDTCARWGGEEFLIMLPETKLEDAEKIAERLRVTLQESPIKYDVNELSVTASFGVQEFRDTDNLTDCIKGADRNLYRAKMAGRNCVVA